MDSILGQTYYDLEIILVDDGSSDKSPHICDVYAKKDARVKVIHKANGGTNSARKAGMEVATGRFIGYVDGDDWIEPEMYEKLYRIAVKSGCSIVESGVIDSWEEKKAERKPYIGEGRYVGDEFKKYVSPYFIYTGTFYQNGLSPYLVTKLFEKKSIESFQMTNEDSKNLMDDVMCTYPAIEAAQSIYVTQECFYHYRVREKSTKRKIRSDMADIVRNNYKKWMEKFISQSAKKQMDFLIMYLLISKAPFVFDDMNEETYLSIYGKIKKDAKIVLYGAGAVGIPLYHYIMNVAKGNLVLWVDKNYQQLQENLPVTNPQEILQCDFEYVIISIMWYSAVESVKKDLEILGIDKEKIIWIQDVYLENPEILLKKICPEYIC